MSKYKYNLIRQVAIYDLIRQVARYNPNRLDRYQGIIILIASTSKFLDSVWLIKESNLIILIYVSID